MEHGAEAHCLHSFFDLWKDDVPFSGVSFFHWLDGPGATAETQKCNRTQLDQRRYGFFDDDQVAASEVKIKLLKKLYVDDGAVEEAVKAVFVQSGEPVHSGNWLIVWSLDRKLHFLHEKHVIAPPEFPFLYWKYGHASVTSGRPVMYAGEIDIGENGIVLAVYPKSGQ